ncbi:MAG TPA: DUF1330 domain-containing protein [Chloroflexia bacterium]|jgi:uncharacterized protein (DUF1330 family)|nr:DUF1330 domain-containing protein [Chloroflexia bacterium]
MVAYVIVDIDVTDPEGYEAYKAPAAANVLASGGRYRVRGGKTEVLEGDWQPNRLVVLEFDSMEQVKAWWNSEEYAPLKDVRHRTTNSRMIVVEGV